jgi:4,5-dihydroxyphthalate decarboxylase
MSLFHAFQQAKETAFEGLERLRWSSLVLGGVYLEEQRALLGEDPYPYGFEINRAALEKLVTYSTEQGLTKTRAVPEELFAAETLTT